MVLEQLKEQLDQQGYYKVGVNISGIFLYYQVINTKPYIIMLMNTMIATPFTKDQYLHMIQKIKENFKQKGFGDIEFLSIISTNMLQYARNLCSEEDTHWILDETTGKLIIYENQNAKFLNINEILQNISVDFHNNMDEIILSDETEEKDMLGKVKKKISYFSLFNTIIIVINIVLFLYMELNGSTSDTEYMLEKGALFWPAVIYYKQWYRIFSYMFLHFGLNHLFNNMLVLGFLGDNLERAVGKIKYLIIYFGSGIFAGIISMIYNMWKDEPVISAGASGAIFGVVGSIVYIIAMNKGNLEDLSNRRLIIFVLLSLYGGLTSQGIDNTAHIAGFICGILLAIILYRKKKSEV